MPTTGRNSSIRAVLDGYPLACLVTLRMSIGPSEVFLECLSGGKRIPVLSGISENHEAWRGWAIAIIEVYLNQAMAGLL